MADNQQVGRITGRGPTLMAVPYVQQIAKRFPYFGHHYFNPQWISYDVNGQPSLLYNNAVYFTVSQDGTHYFHETYSGQFLATQPVVMPSSQGGEAPAPLPEEAMQFVQPAAYHEKPRRHHDNSLERLEDWEEEDEQQADYNWEESRLPVKPCMNPWQKRYRSLHHRRRRHRKPDMAEEESSRRDARCTVVPMFPDVFSIERRNKSKSPMAM